MTLRQRLGSDTRRIHELVDQLLDGEDSLIVLMDGGRAVSYGEGFGLSPCQLELVTIEIERALRAVGGTAPIKSMDRGRRSEQVAGSGDRARVPEREDEHVAVPHERQTEVAMDDALAASFPASDPPAWNPGVARPIPVGTSDEPSERL